MKSDIIFENELLNNEKMIDFVRGKISEWADSIPNHGITDFGRQISIEQLYYRPFFNLTLSTQYESRNKHSKTIPYRGEQPRKCTVPKYSDYNRWDLQMQESTGYETSSNSESVPGSYFVSDCGTCNSTGKITCPTCGGKGEDTCSTCRGKGKVNCSSCSGSGKQTCSSCGGSGHKGYDSCSRCGGSGQVTASGYSDTSQGYRACPSCGGSGKGQQRSCSSCSGSGKITCSSCSGSGKQTCKNCGGSGIVTCKRCSGKGEITCTTCSGQKQIWNYLEVTQKYAPRTESTIATNYDVGQAFPNFTELLFDESFDDIYSEAAEHNLPEDLFEETPIDRIFRKYRSGQLNDSPFGEINHSVRILRQHIKISRTDVYDLLYTYGGKQYRILIYGKDAKFYTLDSPFTDMSDDCFGQAQKAYKRNQLGKSMDYLMTAFQMDVQNLMNDEHNSFYEKLLGKFRASYRKSVAAGTIVSIPVFLLLTLIVYARPVFVFPFIAPIYTGSLPAVHSLIMGAIYLIFSLFFIRTLTNGIHDNFQARLRSASFRSVFTFLFTIVSNALLWVGLIIVSASGVPLIVSRLLLNSEAVMRVIGNIMPVISKIIPGV